MHIPFLGVTQSYLELEAEIDAALKGVLRGGQYILGDNGRPSLWPGCGHATHPKKTERRDELSAYLGKKGVGTLVHYPIPSYKQAAG